MDPQTLYIIIGAVAGLLSGIGIGAFIFRSKAKRKEEIAQQEAQRVINEANLAADSAKKDKLLEAKEEILKRKTEFEREQLQKAKNAEQADQRVRAREQSLNSKTEGIQRKEQELETIKQNLN